MDDVKPSSVCRCCLSANEPVFQMLDVIFNSTGPENAMITALEIYFELTVLNMGMVLDSSLQICLSCQSQLQTVFSFRKQCLESHEFLLRVKEEFQEEIVCEEIPIPDIKLEMDVLTTEEPKKISPRQKKLKPNKKQTIDKPKSTIKKTRTPKAMGPKRLKTSAVDFVAAKYFCFKCDSEKLNYAHFIKHLKSHANSDYKNRDCHLCGDRAVDDYEQHLAAEHPEYRPQQCLSCSANFINYHDLKQHLVSHKSEENVQCQACSATLKSQFARSMHIAFNCGQPNAVRTHYNCHICGYPEATVQKIQEHIFEKHPRDFRKRYFICYHCKRILMGPQGRQTACQKCISWQKKREKQMRDENIAPQHHCEKCKRDFYDAEEFACHQFGKHSSRAFCYICDRAFWTIEEYRAHRRAVHKVKRVFPKMCEECGKVFSTNCMLRDHIAISHTGNVRQIKCAFLGCEKYFFTKKIARAHYVQSHEKHYGYECHYCGKRMNEYGYIFIHMTRAHFPHLKKYACTFEGCDKRFATVTDRKSHMAVHRE